MKSKFAVLLLGLSLFITGCATTQTATNQAPEGKRFREGRNADVVLRFSSWEYTFMTKPFYAEDGFMQQVQRDTLGNVLNKFEIERDMAVVVVGWQYNGDVLKQIVADWKSTLGSCGFNRVVVLRASKNSQLNGSVIVEDAHFPITTAQVTQ